MLETLATVTILSLTITILRKITLTWMSSELEKPCYPADHPIHTLFEDND